MNKDIRLLTTFPRHPKTIKLKRMLGTWEPIITLWLWAAENRPDGNLTGMEPDDIAIAAGWDADAKTLIDALIAVKFLETSINGAYLLHGWSEHNAYAAASEKRIEKAKLAAQARWERRLKGCSEDAKKCSGHAHSNAPSPSPSPSPNKLIKKKKKSVFPIPENFGISDEIRQWAKKKGYTRLEERLEHFVDWAKGGDNKKADWDATFRNAIRGDWAHLNNGNGSAAKLSEDEKKRTQLKEELRYEYDRLKRKREIIKSCPTDHPQYGGYRDEISLIEKKIQTIEARLQ